MRCRTFDKIRKYVYNNVKSIAYVEDDSYDYKVI